MTYRPPAIPTTYAGTRFRSRLEARWAAFFDIIGWPWEYEPVDLNGYIPDFLIAWSKPVLVEVKPIVRWPCMVQDCTGATCHHDPDITEAIEKIARSGWEQEAILVGTAFKAQRSILGAPSIGAMMEVSEGALRVTGDAVLFSCLGCHALSLLNDTTTFNCRRSDCYDGDGHINDPGDVVSLYWREAGNRVQWRRR